MKFKAGDPVQFNKTGEQGVVISIRNSRVAPYQVYITKSSRYRKGGSTHYASGRDLTIVNGENEVKKEIKSTSESNKRTAFEKTVHDMWDSLDDEMEKRELKVFIDDENQPKLKMLNEDDNIGVTEVLLVGSYLVLSHLHHELHEAELKEVTKNVDDMFKGKVSLREIAPENMPEELLELLEKLIDIPTKKPRGKK